MANSTTKTVRATKSSVAASLAAKLDALSSAPANKEPVVFANGFRTNNTKEAAIVRRSMPVCIVAVRWDAEDRSIRVLCDDKKVRTCRVDRFEDLDQGRALFTELNSLVGKPTQLRFKAAGNFSPDTWFSAIEVYTVAKVKGVPF